MQYCSQCKNLYPADMLFCPQDRTQLESRQEFATGMVLRQKYEILEEIGSGGMGQVFRVRDLDFSYGRNESALKIPAAYLAADPSFVQRFRDEAAKARVLSHANIVRIEHIDRTESGVPFLVMELVAGRSLRSWMEQGPRPDWRSSVRIAQEIALALESAHAAGLVHCDIKPENVLSVGKDAPTPLKVTDFGLAKATDALMERVSGAQRKTSWGPGLVVGTPEYMSPEQAQGRELIGPPSDIYSLGVLLFELLTGNVPGRNIGSAEGVRRAHEQKPPASLRGQDHLPAPLTSLVEEMLDCFPDRRPTAPATVARLERLWKAPAAENNPSSPTVPGDARKTTVAEESFPWVRGDSEEIHAGQKPSGDARKATVVEHDPASSRVPGDARKPTVVENRPPSQNPSGDASKATAESRKSPSVQNVAKEHNNRGVALLNQGELNAAVAELRTALRWEPDLASAHSNLGLALSKGGDNVAAVAEFREALRLQPNLATTHSNLGMSLWKLRNYSEALSAYREALRLQRDLAEAHNGLGVLYFDTGDFGPAKAEFIEALRLNPSLAVARRNLARANNYLFTMKYGKPFLYLVFLASLVVGRLQPEGRWWLTILADCTLAFLCVLQLWGLWLIARRESGWQAKFRMLRTNSLLVIATVCCLVYLAYSLTSL